MKVQIKLMLTIFFILLNFIACNHKARHSNLNLTANYTIKILPYSDFDTVLTKKIASEIQSFYHFKTILLPKEDLPGFAFYKTRQRYKADSLLRFEKIKISNQKDIILGLTKKDISTSKNTIEDWGILGLSFCPGQVAIVSTFRIQNGSNSKLNERVTKVVLHELGHSLGLSHCANNDFCLMNDAKGLISTIDKEKVWICDNCKLKLGFKL